MPDVPSDAQNRKASGSNKPSSASIGSIKPTGSIGSTESSEPEERIDPTQYGIALADAVQAAITSFVTRTVQDRSTACGTSIGRVSTPENSDSLTTVVAKLGLSVTSAVDTALRVFLTSDVDAQRTTPLSIIRHEMGPVTELLRSVGCAHANRDPFDESAFPDDVFGIGPYAWQDFGEEVHDAGLRWGAAKAMAHRQRHLGR